MSPRGRTRRSSAFTHAATALEKALGGTARREIVHRIVGSPRPEEALRRLRDGMRAHNFRTARGSLGLTPLVRKLDERTQREGFHVLLEWDHASHRFLDDEIPLLLVEVAARAHPDLGADPEALAQLLDAYFLYLMALLLLRAWDEGDADRNLDRVGELLDRLAGPAGSGRPLLLTPEALLFLAISTYEPDERAFHRLLDRVRALDEPHRTRIALVGAPLLGSHLRWGFPALYHLDLGRMRDDNVADYPWLLFSVATLMKAWTRLRGTERTDPGTGSGKGGGAGTIERRRVAAALLGGLTPDPWAFLGEPPPALTAYREEHAELRALLHAHGPELLEDFRLHRPTAEAYSPLGFHFNFPHNALIAVLLLRVLGEPVPDVPLETLLTGEAPPGDGAGGLLELAGRLTRLAAANPERRRDRMVMMLGYDPGMAVRAYQAVVGALEEAASG